MEIRRRQDETPSTKHSIIGLLVAVILLSACTNTPTNTVQTTPQIEVPVKAPTPQKTETVADRPFTVDTLYALLVAEMAIHRKRYDIALGNYVQQAISTRDLLVAERATQIARGLNARQSALEMSQLWLDLDPTNPDARLIAAIELIEANHLIEAFDLSKQMLEQGETTSFESIAMKAEKGDITTVQELSHQYATLLEKHTDNAGLWLGQSILQQQAGNLEAALDAAKRAKALDKRHIRIAFQETRVLHKMGKTDLARERLSELVEANPKNIGLRARYARIVWTTSPEEAHAQFKILHEQSPRDAEILFSLGLVEKELGLHDSAVTRFNLLLSRNQYPAESHYHLGNILHNKNQLEQALSHYAKVGLGQSYVSALVKATDILIAQNKSAEAIKLVKERQKSADSLVLESFYMLEADIYSQTGQINAAEIALSQAIEEFPDSTRLLYARAMMYAQIDYISAAEKDFRRVLELVPENAAALNALGYTLADRTDRYQEAYEYIKQAYALTPEDPAVIDSMGWVAYRLGNFDEALLQLRRAMATLPDHEIAAHLGEVLWVTGNQQEAISVWKKGLELRPESKIIHKTLHRLEAKIE